MSLPLRTSYPPFGRCPPNRIKSNGPATTLRIQYDSTDGTYYDGPSITTQGTNKWKTQTVGFKNVYFGNRQNNGADFRIAATPGTHFYIDLVYARQVLPRFPYSVQFNPQYYPYQDADTVPTYFMDACSNPSLWPTGISKIEYFGGHAAYMKNADPTALSACFENLKQRGIRLVLETPAIKNWCTTGQACFNATSTWLDISIGRGASVDAIATDLARTATKDLRQPNVYGMSLGDAAREYAHYMKLMRDRYPYMQIFSIENHLYMNTTELAQWVEVVNEECAKIGTPIMDMLIVDHDYNDIALAADRQNLPGLRQTVNTYGPRFGMAYFGAGATDDCGYYSRVLNQGYGLNSLQVNPQLYWVTSWDTLPQSITPEWSTCTQTITLLHFLSNVLGR